MNFQLKNKLCKTATMFIRIKSYFRNLKQFKNLNMRKFILQALAAGLLFSSCSNQKKETVTTMVNPFFTEYATPFQVPPFDQIKLEHYMPAIDSGIVVQEAEIATITGNPTEANFENTVLAYENSGELLRKVQSVFNPLSSSITNPKMQALDRQITPKLTRHRDNISMNPLLFSRIKAVYDKRASLGLDAQQIRLVEKYYQDFQRNGANLSQEDQAKLKTLNEELSKLQLKFGENLLAESNKNFRLVIDKEADLAGLPEDVKLRAVDQAKKDSMEGKWVFTLDKPSMLPFLQYAGNRELREKLYRGYFMRCDNENEFDNKEIIKKIVQLRDEKGKLMGFNNFAEYSIDINMAKTPKAVYDFLGKLWVPSMKIAKADRDAMQKIIDKEGGNFKLAPWDWWYYSDKLRMQKFNLDENEVKPYFTLDNAVNGIFYVANKLYGITFEKRDDIPVYHKEAVAFEVKEANGAHVGVLFMDFHPRDGKKVGAWCTGFRSSAYKNGERIYPLVSMVMNFTRPAGDTPALLTFDEVRTLFHEFGHALHSLFTDGPYQRTSRSVPRDFVELPSQVMENWAEEPEVMKVYAKHYKTGEVIPDSLIAKLEASSTFNQGFETGELVAASILDMDYHTPKNPIITDIHEFEKNSMNKIGLIPEILPRYRSTYFSHTFSGGYSAGYYVYQWAAVLDADAFQAFKETGDIFNQEVAARFRTLLTKSGSDEGMTIYRNFRGKDPSIEPLLKKRGLQ
jgi:peptidyl-dipeptidase Dcp